MTTIQQDWLRFLDTEFKRISKLEKKYVSKVLSSQFRTSLSTEFQRKLEDSFAKRFERSHGVSFNSGTSALHAALLAAGIKSGDEVIVPPLTMAAPALTVLQTGATPIFCDVDSQTLTMHPGKLRDLVTGRTKAVIAVALYGLPSDLKMIKSVCVSHGILLIEDNAECYLGETSGELAGTFGDLAMYSFQASKHLTCGNGGILIGDDDELLNRVRVVGNLGYPQSNKLSPAQTLKRLKDCDNVRHIALGYNYRLPELNAAVALAQLERIEELVAARIFSAKAVLEIVRQFSFLSTQFIPQNSKHSYWCYPIIFDTEERKKSFAKEWEKNGSFKYYAPWRLNYNEPVFEEYLVQAECPNAERLHRRIIQLPTNFYKETERKAFSNFLWDTLRKVK